MSTKLELVNHLLSIAGEARQVTLESGHPSIAQALVTLDTADRDFQTRGWWFNKEYALILVPNSKGEVVMPTETLEFAVTANQLQYQGSDAKSRFVQRGNRVYDNHKHSYNVGHAIVADVTLRLDYEELPSAALTYLKHLAGEQHYVNDDGDAQKTQRLIERRQMAWAALMAAQLKAQAVNRLDAPAVQALKYRISPGFSTGNPNLIGGRPVY